MTRYIQFRNIIQPEELYLSYMEEDSFLIDWIQGLCLTHFFGIILE